MVQSPDGWFSRKMEFSFTSTTKSCKPHHSIRTAELLVDLAIRISETSIPIRKLTTSEVLNLWQNPCSCWWSLTSVIAGCFCRELDSDRVVMLFLLALANSLRHTLTLSYEALDLPHFGQSLCRSHEQQCMRSPLETLIA